MKKYVFIIWAWVFAMFILASSVQAGFVDNGNDTVTDTVTGLVWQQGDSQNDSGGRSWEDALDYCECLNLAERSDWRLPNVRELESLTDVDRYDPAIDPLFDCRSSGYWSSSTGAYYPDFAWVVYFDDGDVDGYYKTTGNYVRCVRSRPSGSFDYLDHFVISNISSPQVVGAGFSATITAVDANGNRLWGFNGSVGLTSSLGGVSPTSVYLASGQGTASVKLYNGGYTLLNCSGYGGYGNSNYFTVTGGSACNGKIFGKVVDANGDIVYQADVILQDTGGSVIDDTETDAEGKYSFTGIACGTYDVGATKNNKPGIIYDISVKSTLSLPLPDIRLQLNAGTRGTPVILVPGMMGSTLPGAIFPELPKKCPAKHVYLYDYKGICGWKEIRQVLKAEGFKYYDCPWDWRMKAQDVYDECLKDVIDKALLESTTGKVHIVTHSMGGLVVRSYIQSSDYRNDIDKFAMVGTPNRGSSNPYYIWEGGDPKLADDITDHGWKSILNPYSNTIQLMWWRRNPLTWSNWRHNAIRKFVRKEVPSLRQLMNTEDFLKDKDGPWAVETDGNENEWLKDLNGGRNGYEDPESRMSADGNGGKVEVRLFVGKKSNSTIEYIRTENRNDPHFRNDLYEDGIPRSPEKKYATKGWGDGTVPLDSATWPADDGWAYLYGIQLDEDHISLIKRYKSEIVSFLKEGTVGSSLPVLKTEDAGMREAAAPVSQISFSVVGDMRLYITSPGAQSTGIDPVSGNPVENIPNSSCIFGSEGGGVSIEDPAAGVYQVTYFGEAARDFSLDIGYGDAVTTETQRFRGFRPASARTFNVTVAPSATPRITVTPVVQAPTGLQADVYSSGGEKSRLTWTASGSAGVAGYNIYSVSEDDPYFALLTSVGSGVTTYDTVDLWSSTDAVPVMTYAVAAVNGSGVESFFSNTAQNNDRDHDWATDAEEEILTTDPSIPDTDGDGLMDGEEQNYGTNAKFADTDGDGFNDGVEVKRGSDPLDATSKPVSPMSWLLPLLLGN